MVTNPAVQAVISGTFSLGIPLLIAAYELRTLRRYRPRGGGGPRPAPPPQPLPIQGGTRPLPICLVPTEQWRAPAPTRLKELA